jgi:hypothetical protein
MCKFWLDEAADRSKMVVVSAKKNVTRGNPGKAS